MSDDSKASADLKKQVEARVQEEEQNAPPPAEKKETALAIDFLRTCLFGNRVGDATLFAAMFRGQFIFVERWGRWLRWAGHHWGEDINSRHALAAIERVCEQYQRIMVESNDAEEGSDLAKLIRKRLNVLRDMSGREKPGPNSFTKASNSSPTCTMRATVLVLTKLTALRPKSTCLHSRRAASEIGRGGNCQGILDSSTGRRARG